MKKRNSTVDKKAGMHRWILLRFAAIAMIVWIVSMSCVTVNEAVDNLSMMVHIADEYSRNLRDDIWYSPHQQDIMMMDSVKQDLDINERFELQNAALFLNGEGEILLKSGDYVTFRYCTEDEFFQPEDTSLQWEYGWLNIDEDINSELNSCFKNFSQYITNDTVTAVSRIAFLKLTGSFSGSEFIPSSIKMITLEEAEAALKYSSREPLTLFQTRVAKDLIQAGNLKWNTLYENPDYDSNSQTETFYAVPYNSELMYFYDKGGEVTFESEKYGSALELLESEVSELTDYYRISSPGEYNLLRFVSSDGRYYEEKDLGVYTIVTGSPLGSAVKTLIPVYIGTLILFLLCIILFSSYLKRKVMKPINEVNRAMSSEMKYVMNSHIVNHCDCAELSELMDNYGLMHNHMLADKDEIKRLTTALDYAREAEENRRQMTSNIAHELKTPLAVIRSYSEGLQEHIAEEKRDLYVQVIMDETDKLDEMVMEMLDLSRLEAGRVKLNRCEFSLEQMAKSVFERLSLLAADKNISIEFEFNEPCIIHADEVRIQQAITNLAVNAVKYVPENGWIRIIGKKKSGEMHFAVQNAYQPLHYEQLNKVWDTFYRTDESRNSKGTGLGLAIVKSIVKLHGGTVYAANIKDGVEFGFRIPT